MAHPKPGGAGVPAERGAHVHVGTGRGDDGRDDRFVAGEQRIGADDRLGFLEHEATAGRDRAAPVGDHALGIREMREQEPRVDDVEVAGQRIVDVADDHTGRGHPLTRLAAKAFDCSTATSPASGNTDASRAVL